MRETVDFPAPEGPTIAVIDSTKAGKTVGDVIGDVPSGGHVDIPIVATLDEALALEPRPNTLVIGVAPAGGKLSPAWRSTIVQALEEGLDVVNGLHMFLDDDPEFRAAAARGGARIYDFRKPPERMEVATGREHKRLTSPLFGFPHGLAVHPDGRTVYLTSEQKRLLIALDVESLEIAKQLSTGMDGSHMVVLSPDGSRAYITDRGSARVTVVDTARWAVVTHVPAGDGVEGIALTPDGGLLVVANRNDGNVHIIDTATLRPTATVSVGKEPVRVACPPGGRLALVSHRVSSDVHVIDLATRQVTTRVDVGAEPGGMAFSADGRRAFVANTGAGTVSVLDLKTMKVLATYPGGSGPDGMALGR